MVALRSQDPAIGEVIRQLRERLGLTQLQLAARAGVTDTTLRSVERGRKAYHRSTLVALASALGTNVDDVILAARSRAGVAR